MPGRGELVGREAELSTLLGCLDAALGFQPQVVLISGDAGIGKTRLAGELARLAATRGVLTAWGNALEDEAPPYWPWRQALRALGDVVDLAAIAGERGLGGDLAGLAPGLFAGPAPDASDGHERFRQFEAAARLLREVCRVQPVAIVLDDLHWADGATVLLLEHLARSLTDERLLLVGTTRPLGDGPADLLLRFERTPAVTVLRLVGLDAPAVREHLRWLVGRPVEVEEAAEVHAMTAGNPLFVGEVGRALAAAPGGSRPVGASLGEAIAARLARLPEPVAALVGVASVIGHEFSVPVVADVAAIDPLVALELVDQATRAGLFEPGRTQHTHRFTHALVADAVLTTLGPARRTELHRRAAAVLLEHHAHDLGPHVFQIAHHRAAAAIGADAEAADWLRRAGEQAMRQLAFEEAASLFQRALAIGGRELDRPARASLLIAAGQASHAAQDLDARDAACMVAAELARAEGDAEQLGDAALVLEVVELPEHDELARRLAEEALLALGPEPSARRARLLARVVETYVFQPDLAAVGALADEALVVAEQTGDQRAVAAALRARRLVRSGPDGLADRRAAAARLLAIGKAAHDVRAELEAHLWEVDAGLEVGDLAAVARAIDGITLCAPRVRGPLARFEVLRCRAVLAQAEGRFDDARALLEEAVATVAPLEHPVGLVLRSGLLPAIGRHVGQDDEAIEAATLAGAPEGTLEEIGLVAQLNAAAALAAGGRTEEAARIFRAVGAPETWAPPPHVELVTASMGIDIGIAVEDPSAVRDCSDRLLRFAERHVASGTSAISYNGPVALWLGRAERHLGDLPAAVAHLDAAMSAAAANGARAYLVEAQVELAEALRLRAGPGDDERSEQLRGEAEPAAAALGMRPFLDRLRPSRPADDHDPLSRREREVAGLLAEGLTNKRIAEQLFLSERTVENHVQHILQKLGLANRSQVAVWVTARS